MGGIATVSAGLIGIQILLSQTSYTVSCIIDGDTFETTERQLIRLNGIDAPEKGHCGYEESTSSLAKRILGKKVFLKVVYRDRYERLISNVYSTRGEFINEQVARSGQGIVFQKSKTDPRMISASQYAISRKLGVHGLPCTQEANTEKPECTIKANVNDATDERTYHIPGCQSYSYTKIQLHMGDRWFCSEKEAIQAGFKKARACR